MIKKIVKEIIIKLFSKRFLELMGRSKVFFQDCKFLLLFLTLTNFFIFFLDILCIFLLGSYVSNEFSLFNRSLTGIKNNLNFETVILLILFLQILREFFTFLNTFLPTNKGLQIEKIVKLKVLNKFFSTEQYILSESNKNNAVLKIYGQTSVFAGLIKDTIIISSHSFLTIFYLVSIIVFQPLFSSIILSILLVILIFTNQLIYRQELLGIKVNNYALKLHDKFSDLVHGFKDIISFNAQNSQVEILKNLIKIFLLKKKDSISLTLLFPPLIRSLSILILCLLIFFYSLINSIELNESLITQSIILIFLLFRIQSPLLEINSRRSKMLNQVGPSLNVVNILQLKDSKYNIKNTQKLKFLDKIEIKNLDFKYQQRLILKKLNMVIKKNQITGIFGDPGSGKSTIANILLKKLLVPNNKIFIDSVCLNKFKNDDVRKNISLVSQRGFLFHTSILKNITMFQKFDKKLFDRVVSTSGVNDFSENLAKKYNTIIGGKEIPLSGGQKQRIFIARALYSKSQIVILDEATSSQDTMSEIKIIQKIKEFKKNFTILIIAHKFTTLKYSDYIYNICNGCISEEGTWKTLSKLQNSNFKKILDKQTEIKKE